MRTVPVCIIILKYRGCSFALPLARQKLTQTLQRKNIPLSARFDPPQFPAERAAEAENLRDSESNQWKSHILTPFLRPTLELLGFLFQKTVRVQPVFVLGLGSRPHTRLTVRIFSFVSTCFQGSGSETPSSTRSHRKYTSLE